MSTNYETATAAKYLAGCGYRIFPISPWMKGGEGTLPNAWQVVASRDAAQVASWWPAGSRNNIGVLGGDGKLILDIDVSKGGFESLLALEAKHGALPPTYTVTTPRGGEHRYFLGPDVPNSASKIGAGLDIKSRGGYVVGPWSYTSEIPGKQGAGFYCIKDTVPLPLATVPAWLTQLAGKPKAAAAGTPGTTSTFKFRGIEAGARADLMAALNHLATRPEFASYSLWAEVGLALLSLGDEGREIWCDWSMRAPGYGGSDSPESFWARNSGKDSRTDYRHVFTMAQRHGWKNPGSTTRDPNTVQRAPPSATSMLTLSGTPAVGPAYVDMPLEAARSLIGAFYNASGLREIHYWQSGFMAYEAGIYVPASEDGLRSLAWKFFEHAADRSLKSKQVNEVIKALEGVSYLPEKIPVPCWLDNPKIELPDLLICQNGAFDLAMGTRHELTPALFATIRLPVDYAPDVPRPAAWIQFLASLWPNDQESIDTLQELFGLMLTPITKFQKIFLMVGPRRSGKGTILRTLRRLLGNDNVAGPALSTLAHQYGMQGLIGKLAALIGDARINARSSEMAIVVERLLSISGEDSPNVERKFLPDWTGRLPTRIVMSSNELPHLDDPSGAMASRFVILVLQESFFGREDLDLESKLVPEMPAILRIPLIVDSDSRPS